MTSAALPPKDGHLLQLHDLDFPQMLPVEAVDFLAGGPLTDFEGKEVFGDEVPVPQVNDACVGFLDLHPEFDFHDTRQSPEQVFDRMRQVVDANWRGGLVGSNRLGGRVFLVSKKLLQGGNAVGCWCGNAVGCEEEDGADTDGNVDDNSSGEQSSHFWPS